MPELSLINEHTGFKRDASSDTLRFADTYFRPLLQYRWRLILVAHQVQAEDQEGCRDSIHAASG